MFSKRPDKHTTGLINLRNDCFANSSLQAYSALPGLTEYLNTFLASFLHLEQFVETRGISVPNVVSAKLKRSSSSVSVLNGSAAKSKFSASSSQFAIPLHKALATCLKKLQETRMTSHTVSAWTFLHALESIFNAKISRSQHDAQELTQLINETLEHENVKVRAFLSAIKHNLTDLLQHTETGPSATDYEQLESIRIPDFPISGLVLSQMKCTLCDGVSAPNFTPFSMLTLHAPEEWQLDLETLLHENKSETIEGYQCMRCRITAIVKNELASNEKLSLSNTENDQTEKKSMDKTSDELGESNADKNHDSGGEDAKDSLGDPTSLDIVKTLQDLIADPLFCINDDVEPHLQKFINSYNKCGLDIADVTSTILRTTQILKPPRIFGLHLSRSSFNGVAVTRNLCRVAFKEHLKLSIGKDYLEELRLFQQAENDDEAVLAHNYRSSNVLTTDSADMEDEEVQREDVDQQGDEDEDDDDEDAYDTMEGSSEVDTVPGSAGEDIEQDSDVASQHTDVASTATNSTADTLNHAPITDGQTKDLRKHFRQFKFNDNDVYRYRLRAIIKHIGSHTQGHYECYKKKPLFVKDTEGRIFKLLPEIDGFGLEDGENSEQNLMHEEGATEAEAGPPASAPAAIYGARLRGVSSSSTSSLHRRPTVSDDARSVGSLAPGSPSIGSITGNDSPRLPSSESLSPECGGLRRKISNMVNRRPEIIQANPREANILEIVTSGSETPAELLINREDEYFSAALAAGAADSNANGDGEALKIKLKKLSSIISKPYWRMSDASVHEVTTEQVLSETGTVYMFYYERVDRKQVKGVHR